MVEGEGPPRWERETPRKSRCSPAGLLSLPGPAHSTSDPGPQVLGRVLAHTGTEAGVRTFPRPVPSGGGRAPGPCLPFPHPILSAFSGLGLQLSPDSLGLVDAVARQPGGPPLPQANGGGASPRGGAWSELRSECTEVPGQMPRPGTSRLSRTTREMTLSFNSPGALSFFSEEPQTHSSAGCGPSFLAGEVFAG